MKKYVLDLELRSIETLRPDYVLLRLCNGTAPLLEMQPGQFVEVRVPDSPATFLRRPISINRVDRERGELWLLIHTVGEGTRALARLKAGALLNVVLPLGNGFTLPARVEGGTSDVNRYVLVGGGVGTAPLLFMGEELVARGHEPIFMLGARSGKDLLQLDRFEALGQVCVTTEDGTVGEKGFVTQHSLWTKIREGVCPKPALVYTCGPKPMMVAVSRLCDDLDVACEASLENLMACGLGACLCCVENTTEGNVCVCKEGPVFPTSRLRWKAEC